MVAHKTAIARKKPSAPSLRLDWKNRIVGRTLDYGSGRGFDAYTYGWECFDPHYSPDMPVGRFDTIVCNYVLNVIESKEERDRVVADIRSRLVEGGCAYISVRNDRKNLNGYTSIGTWQGLVVLDLPVEHRCAGYVTYRLEA
jgi:hypothetical protein